MQKIQVMMALSNCQIVLDDRAAFGLKKKKKVSRSEVATELGSVWAFCPFSKEHFEIRMDPAFWMRRPGTEKIETSHSLVQQSSSWSD